jgi:hypothetical protein
VATDREQEGTSAALELIGLGSEVIGGAAGAAIGLVGGPPGAVGGAVAGVAVTRGLKRVAQEIHDRALSPRQRARAGLALMYAADEIAARLMAGEAPREDGFFDERPGERPPSQELLEGVLLKATSEYEERKVRYLGALYASVVFEPSASPASANSFLRTVDSMTYGELVCLALITDERYRDSLSQLKRLQRRYGHMHFGRLIQAELAGIETDQGGVVSRKPRMAATT